MKKRDRFPDLMVWLYLLFSNPILPDFPSLSPPGFLLFSQLDDPLRFFSLDHFATAGESSAICNVFRSISYPVDLLASPGGQRL